MFQAMRFLVVLLTLMLMAGCTGGRDYFQQMEAPNYQHTPSNTELQRAQKEYRAGRYPQALQYYKQAARWADKFAQYNVGVMYLRGEGVERDLPRGWAWLALSAERDYPQMRQPSDKLYAALSPSDQIEGRRILEDELLPEYGDDVAVERTARRMDRDKRKATGTRTGSTAAMGRLTVIDGRGTHSGADYYDSSKWDFEQIVEAETRFMFNWARGNVTLGDMELLDDDEEAGEADQPRETRED